MSQGNRELGPGGMASHPVRASAAIVFSVIRGRSRHCGPPTDVYQDATTEAATMKYGQITGVDKPVARIVQGRRCSIPPIRPHRSHFSMRSVEQGGTTFDTAQSYLQGDAERLLGRWMAERRNRDRGAGHHQGMSPHRSTGSVSRHTTSPPTCTTRLPGLASSASISTSCIATIQRFRSRS